MEQLLLPPIIAAALMWIQWLLWGDKNDKVITVLYEPPSYMSILECGILMDDAVNSKDIALELYNLYLKDILIIKEDNVFILNPLASESKLATLTPAQRLVLTTFVGSGMWNYKSKRAYARVKDLKFQLYEIMTKQGYFALSPVEQRKSYFAIGAVIFAGPLSWNIYSFFDDKTPTQPPTLLPWNLIAGLCIAGIIIAYASLLMVKKTEAGTKAKVELLGLKEFIVTAESDRIKFVLENNIDAYHALLPYAALFNSLEKWIAPLNDMEKTLATPQLKNITDTISAMDVDMSITEKSRFLRSLLDLFIYGTQILGSLSPRRKRYVDEDYNINIDHSL